MGSTVRILAPFLGHRRPSVKTHWVKESWMAPRSPWHSVCFLLGPSFHQEAQYSFGQEDVQTSQQGTKGLGLSGPNPCLQAGWWSSPALSTLSSLMPLAPFTHSQLTLPHGFLLSKCNTAQDLPECNVPFSLISPCPWAKLSLYLWVTLLGLGIMTSLLHIHHLYHPRSVYEMAPLASRSQDGTRRWHGDGVQASRSSTS